jgi:UDP-3-O-[3-hydroxymyristoyl] glucosamine N-acyltransferase
MVGGMSFVVAVEEGVRGVEVREGVGHGVWVGGEVGVEVKVEIAGDVRVGVGVAVGVGVRNSLPIRSGKLQLKSKRKRMVRMIRLD